MVKLLHRQHHSRTSALSKAVRSELVKQGHTPLLVQLDGTVLLLLSSRNLIVSRSDLTHFSSLVLSFLMWSQDISTMHCMNGSTTSWLILLPIQYKISSVKILWWFYTQTIKVYHSTADVPYFLCQFGWKDSTRKQVSRPTLKKNCFAISSFTWPNLSFTNAILRKTTSPFHGLCILSGCKT